MHGRLGQQHRHWTGLVMKRETIVHQPPSGKIQSGAGENEHMVMKQKDACMPG